MPDNTSAGILRFWGNLLPDVAARTSVANNPANSSPITPARTRALLT